jgi:hypothetical protein
MLMHRRSRRFDANRKSRSTFCLPIQLREVMRPSTPIIDAAVPLGWCRARVGSVWYRSRSGGGAERKQNVLWCYGHV